MPSKTSMKPRARPAPEKPPAPAPTARTRGRRGDDPLVAALGQRIKKLRVEGALTLDQLATRSGVSRAMLSKVERGEKSPTLSIISKIGRGLNVNLSALIGAQPDPAPVAVIRLAERTIFTDPNTGMERHLLSPIHIDNGVELLMHRIPPGASSGELPVYTTPTEKYLVVHEGTLTAWIEKKRYVLTSGDALFFEVREPYRLANGGKTPCVYYMAIVRRR